MRLGHRLDDRETEARSAPASRLVAAAEPFEGARREAGRESGALVHDVQHDPVGIVDSCEADCSGTVPQRVLNEIAERLLDARPVELGVQAASVGLDPPPRLARPPLVPHSNPVQQNCELDRLRAKPQDTLVEPREEQQILCELRQPVSLLADRAERRLEIPLGPRRLERELDLEEARLEV